METQQNAVTITFKGLHAHTFIVNYITAPIVVVFIVKCLAVYRR